MSAFSDLGSFASGLLSTLNEQAGLGENAARTLDSVNPLTGNVVNFGSLGSFASQIDQTAQRQYVEDGFVRDVRPRQSEILMQQPELTLIIKKRLFSSLAENYRPELMDAQERLFYRTTKVIFQHKCRLIAAYERLTKIERIIVSNGILDSYMSSAVFAGLDALDAAGGSSLIDSNTRRILETLRKVKAFSDPLYETTWLVDRELPALSDLGPGAGTFELTNISSFSSTTSVNFGGGSASFNIEDPYKLMIVTLEEIDRAIVESSAGFLNNAFFRITQNALEDTTDSLRNQLNDLRLARGSTRIRFFLSENTVLFKKVRAIIDEEGREILFTYDGGALGFGGGVTLDQSATEGINGLNSQEADLFEQVVKNIYQLFALKQSTEIDSFQFNKDTNFVRQQLYLHYGNKPMIQPMDIVHAYISTQTQLDPKIAGDLNYNFGGGDLLNGITDTVGAITDTIDSIASAFGGTVGSYAVTEKDAIAGPEFPMWLWNLMRNDFTKQGAGTHIFAGVVTTARHQYSNGKYTLDVSCGDNTEYFKLSRINTNPSIDVFNGGLYDPLTPFDLTVDSSNGFLRGELPPLLPENQLLLQTGVIKFKNGRYRGQPASQEIYQATDLEFVGSKLRKRLEDPDGFIYRWKRGIQSLTLLSEPHPSGNLPSESSPAMTVKPFAGQDIMNVLSLLITGQPYNFNTFMRAAINSGAISRDELLNDAGSRSFYKGLLNEINKTNATWGNFLPFKKLVINEGAYSFLQSGEFDISASNKKISNLLRERAQRFDQLVKFAPGFANNPQYLNVNASGSIVSQDFAKVLSSNINTNLGDTDQVSKLGQDILRLDFEIQEVKTALQNSLQQNSNINTADGSIKIFGDDVSYDSDFSGNTGITQDEKIKEREEFRKKINYLTQRRLWKVKANDDTNLFIVDDAYDKNYDIQAFSKELAGNLDLFNSTYQDVATQISNVAQILGLEVFADSQGHIQARPPQYNRMPSSVFAEMVAKKQETGIQIYPDYLENLFLNIIKGVSDRIEILEDEIRIRMAALGFTTDSSAAAQLKGKLSTRGTTSFAFVTNESDGLLGGKDIRVLLDQANPDFADTRVSTALTALTSTLTPLNNVTVNFDIVQQTLLVNEQALGNGTSEADINAKIQIIGQRLQQKTGNPAPTKTDLLSNFSTPGTKSQVDTLNLTEQISRLIAERAESIKTLSNAVKNLDQGVKLNSDSGTTSLPSFSLTQTTYPDILEHMIEDEDFDDLGEGSGKRYVIRDHQIINFSVVETPPPFTAIEARGLFAEGLAAPPEGLSVGGGNAISTAWAVDFDMQRMYGFRSMQVLDVPFLSNPESQLAPYAVAKLNIARKNIFQGSLTIAGNEFIQPGEVYWLESNDMLFYCESVTNDFSWGGSYTTRMQLTYGRPVGTYIPTILDIVGKGLYTNKNQSDLIRHQKTGNADGSSSIGVLVVDSRDTEITSTNTVEKLVEGSYGDSNRKILTNIILVAGGILGGSTGRKATIEIRTYSGALTTVANAVKNYIINPVQSTDGQGKLQPDMTVNSLSQMKIDSDSISVVNISLNDPNEKRSPSSGAWSRAKEIYATSSIPTPSIFGSSTSVDPMGAGLTELTGYIIDVWVTFSDQATTSSVTPGQSTTDQAAISALQQTLQNFDAKIKGEPTEI